jgi:hypothetical protein
MLIDFNFLYKYSIRKILINKISVIKNTLEISDIKKINLLFNLKKLEDIDDTQLYNNFFLIKFFFGKIAYFSKTKKYFLLGTWYYNTTVQLILNKKKYIYLILFNVYNNIIINVEKKLINTFCKKNINVFALVVKDLNIYSELKTNMALFNIKKPLNIKIYFSGKNFKKNILLIKNLKYI